MIKEVEESVQQLIDANLSPINETFVTEIAIKPLETYPNIIDQLKTTLKAVQDGQFFKENKKELQDELKLYTAREKDYLDLIEDLTNIYNNDYAVPNHITPYGRNAQNKLVLTVKDMSNFPLELKEWINNKIRTELVQEWYEEQYKKTKILPLVEGITAYFVKRYKGIPDDIWNENQ